MYLSVVPSLGWSRYSANLDVARIKLSSTLTLTLTLTLTSKCVLAQSMVGGVDIEDLGINAVTCGHAPVDVSPRGVTDFPAFLQRDEVRSLTSSRRLSIVDAADVKYANIKTA